MELQKYLWGGVVSSLVPWFYSFLCSRAASFGPALMLVKEFLVLAFMGPYLLKNFERKRSEKRD